MMIKLIGDCATFWRSVRSCCAATIATFCILAAALSANGQERTPAAKNDRISMMIESLVNRNPAPEIKKYKSRMAPVFPSDYDWDEQRRVLVAFGALGREQSSETWDRLVESTTDSRYSLTLAPDGDHGRGMNYSVGRICRVIAFEQLLCAVRPHLSKLRPGSQGNIPSIGISLLEWRTNRARKSLYELQIEACEVGLDQVSAASNGNWLPRMRDFGTLALGC